MKGDLIPKKQSDESVDAGLKLIRDVFPDAMPIGWSLSEFLAISSTGRALRAFMRGDMVGYRKELAADNKKAGLA